GVFARSLKGTKEYMSRPSTITNTIVDTIKINQNRFDSWLATGSCGFKIEGELSPHAARRIEDISIAERTIPQRLILCRGSLLESGILTVLTSHFPKNICLTMDTTNNNER